MHKFSRNGRWLAFGQEGSQIGRWEVAPGRELRVVKGHSDNSYVTGLSFLVSNQLLVSAGSDGVRLVDLTTERQVASLSTQHVTSIIWSDKVVPSPDVKDPRHPKRVDDDEGGGLLVACGAGGVDIWPVRQFDRMIEFAEPTRVLSERCTVAHAGGQLLAVACELDRVALIDLTTRKERSSLNCEDSVYDLAVSPDSSWVVTGSYNGTTASIWDVHSGELLLRLPVSRHAQFAFSREGRWLVTNDVDACVFWETSSWQSIRGVEKSSGQSGPVAFSHDGSLVAAAVDSQRVTLVALPSAAKSSESRPAVGVLSRSSESNADVFRVIGTLQSPQAVNLQSLCFSVAGDRLAAGTSNGTVHIWDLAGVQAGLADIGLGWNQPASVLTRSNTEDESQRWYVVSRVDETERIPGPNDEFRLQQPGDIEYRTKIIEANPNDPRPYAWRGNSYRRLGRPQEATADYRRCLALADKRIEANENDSDAYSARGYANLQLGIYEETIADFDRRLVLTPEDVDALYWRALSHHLLRNYGEAAADFTRFIKLRQGLQRQVVQRAYGYLQGDYEHLLGAREHRTEYYKQAITGLEEFVRIPAEGSWAAFRTNSLNGLAWLLVTGPKEIRDPEKALSLAQEAVRLAPDNGGFRNTLGIAHYLRGDWKSAIETLLQAAHTSGDRATAYDFLFLAMSFAQVGNREQSRVYLDRGITWLDNHASLSPRWSMELNQIRAEAEALVQDSTDSPANQTVDKSKPGVKTSETIWLRQIDEYSEAIKANPNDGVALTQRGLRYTALERHEEAKADFENANRRLSKQIEADPKNPQLFYMQGHAHYRLHQYDLAVADFTQAVNLQPDNELFAQMRAYTYRNQCFCSLKRTTISVIHVEHSSTTTVVSTTGRVPPH